MTMSNGGVRVRIFTTQEELRAFRWPSHARHSELAFYWNHATLRGADAITLGTQHRPHHRALHAARRVSELWCARDYAAERSRLRRHA